MKLELILIKYSDRGDCNETGLAAPDPEARRESYLIAKCELFARRGVSALGLQAQNILHIKQALLLLHHPGCGTGRTLGKGHPA